VLRVDRITRWRCTRASTTASRGLRCSSTPTSVLGCSVDRSHSAPTGPTSSKRSVRVSVTSTRRTTPAASTLHTVRQIIVTESRVKRVGEQEVALLSGRHCKFPAEFRQGVAYFLQVLKISISAVNFPEMWVDKCGFLALNFASLDDVSFVIALCSFPTRRRFFHNFRTAKNSGEEESPCPNPP